MTLAQSERLCLGTAQFGYKYGIANKTGQPRVEEVKDILNVAYSNGINTIDTAMTYGESESILGDAGISKFNIITKIPSIKNCTLIWLENKVKISLESLKINNLHAVLFHDSEDLLGRHGARNIDFLNQLKREGIVSKIGVSIYNPEELDFLWSIFKPDLVQVPFNLIDRRIEKSGWLERLNSEGVEIHARSIFLQGLLLLKQNDLPTYFFNWNSLLGKWYSTVKEFNLDPVSVCFNFVFSNYKFSKLVIGVDSAIQLSDILSKANQIQYLQNFNFMESSDPKLFNPAMWEN